MLAAAALYRLSSSQLNQAARACVRPHNNWVHSWSSVAQGSTPTIEMAKAEQAKNRTLWLRHETKGAALRMDGQRILAGSPLKKEKKRPYEERVTITPETAKQLMGQWDVHVERSPTRIIPDKAYVEAGCALEETGAWAALPKDDSLLIVGLKELAHDSFPVVNAHTYFAHVFKGQEGWQDVMSRYKAGKGVLYDYEYLANPDGKNVGAAMSPFAGFVGCAVGVRAWCAQRLGTPLAPVKVSTRAALVGELQGLVDEVKKQGGEAPTVLVMGALGRCGGGAADCATRVGLPVIKWDQAETKAGGPFPQILTDADIFINCILLQGSMPPFVTQELLAGTQGRRLSVITDVSCDPNSAHNPLPIYSDLTSWEEPARRLLDGPTPLDLISIDNLPSVLAREASEAFAELLLPALLQYPRDKGWANARKIFEEKLALLDGEKEEREEAAAEERKPALAAA